MKPQPIRFAHLVKTLEFNKISLVRSPPAPSRCMYFIGSERADAFFPYQSGPVQYLDREYRNDEMIPVRLIHSLAKHLKLEWDKFWRDADAVRSSSHEDAARSHVGARRER